MSQNHCVRIFSGDSNQGIYGFRGAINDLSKVEASNTLPLSQVEWIHIHALLFAISFFLSISENGVLYT